MTEESDVDEQVWEPNPSGPGHVGDPVPAHLRRPETAIDTVKAAIHGADARPAEASAAEQMAHIFEEAKTEETREWRKSGVAAAKALGVWQPGHGGELEPVRVFHRLEHDFEKKPDGKRNCARCGEPKKWIGHHAYPASFNAGGSSRNPHAWQNEKKAWTAYFIELMEAAKLPKGLGRVFVEGTLCFPTKRMAKGPDQGNYRHPIEKFLGDALQEGGWLQDDNWLAYSFGNLGWQYEKDQRWMELVFLPSWEVPDVEEAVQGRLV